jgi:hypothetical protein
MSSSTSKPDSVTSVEWERYQHKLAKSRERMANFTEGEWQRHYLHNRRWYYKTHPTAKNLAKLEAAEQAYEQFCHNK